MSARGDVRLEADLDEELRGGRGLAAVASARSWTDSIWARASPSTVMAAPLSSANVPTNPRRGHRRTAPWSKRYRPVEPGT